jgi:hypothetical protein
MSSPLGNVITALFVGANNDDDSMVVPPQGSAFFKDVEGNYYDGLQKGDCEDRIAPGSAVLTDGKARALSDREAWGLLRYVNGTQGDERCILLGMEDMSSMRRARRKMALQRRNDNRNGGVVVDECGDNNNDNGCGFDINVGLTWTLG